MKSPALLLVSLCLVASAFAGPDERVAEIREWYDTVQKSKHTAERKIKFESESDPLAGGFTIREFDGGWKSITVSYGAGDHAGLDEHYYFKDGKLFFVYVVTQTWSFHPDTTDEKPKTVDTRTEDRYYYDGDACVRRLTRTATSEEADKLPAIVGKLEQKKVDPGDEAKTHAKQATKLLAAKTAADVLAIYDFE